MTLPIELNDRELIKFLREHNEDILFISDEKCRKEFINKIPKEATELEDIFNPAKKNTLNVLDFWERLLIEAIQYLKWHDLTEFPLKKKGDKYIRPSSIRSNYEQAEAYSAITEGSLGVYKLKEYFDDFMEFERLLYGAEQFYRDHVYHIIRVWLIGQYILTNYIRGKFPLIIGEDTLNLRKRKESEAKIIRTRGPRQSKKNIDRRHRGTLFEGEEDAIWCIIALTHDLGYPLGKLDEINNRLRKMMNYFAKTGLEEFIFAFPQQNQFINDAILKYMSSRIYRDKGSNDLYTHIQAKYYLKFSRSFENFDHGLISCILLAKNLIYFMETNYNFDHKASLNAEEARQFTIRREILRAIASHTCPAIYHLKPNSFSFLLLLSDELQFWGRPTFESLRYGGEKRPKIYLNKFSGTAVSFTVDCATCLEDERMKEMKQESLSSYFQKKAELFKQVLRVALDAEKRKFALDFTIKDENNWEFYFKAEPMERPIMKLNGKIIEHKPLMKLSPKLRKGQDGLENLYKELLETTEFF